MSSTQPFTETEANTLRDKIIAESPLGKNAKVQVYERYGVWYVEDKGKYKSYCNQSEYDEANSSQTADKPIIQSEGGGDEKRSNLC